MRWFLIGFLICIGFLVSLAVVGCGGCDPIPHAGADAPPTPSSSVAKSTNFEAAACGSITGFVTWRGPIPEATTAFVTLRRIDGSGFDNRVVTYANSPHIDRATRGLEGAVVFLRAVDPNMAKPWDLPPVLIEFHDAQLLVRQGERVGRAGFVRTGEPVTMQSAEPYLHILRGRGAAFFACTFPEPKQPLTRTFDSCGRIDLTSADGCYWQSAELYVCDHPYYTTSDKEGRFRFTDVPAGHYDLVVWHPNWTVARMERNPESGLPWRLIYAPPLESSRPVVVSRGRATLANLTLPN